MVDSTYKSLSISRQCRLLGLNRSSYYLKPKAESELNLELLHLMDQHYLKHPDYGARRMYKWLKLDKGYHVSSNRIERLYYRVMGLRSLQPGPHTSKPNKSHKVYPYLLRHLSITQPNQVWAMDITFIPMAKGYLYLTAIIDLYSRYVLHWSVSNSMDALWCTQVFEQAVDMYQAPEIINTDQGSQFTSNCFTQAVKKAGSKLSMDGKGRAIDNVFIERLWRTVKYEHIKLYSPENGTELAKGLNRYFKYYNHKRRHSSIDDKPPAYPYFSFIRPLKNLKVA